jgi:hypothetical protein
MPNQEPSTITDAMRAPTKAALAPPRIAPNVNTPEIKLSLIIASEIFVKIK